MNVELDAAGTSTGAPPGGNALETAVDVGSQADAAVDAALVAKKPRLRAKP